MRFTLRDLFWLTVVVALTLGWGISSANWDRRMRLTKRHAEALRVSLENANHNHVAIREAMLSENPDDWSLLEDDLATVDWELADREIP